MRRPITALAALILRIFFRDIEVVGLHRVPEDGAVVFVLNHPSGLVDPLFILTLAPKPVTFLGKATLFSMPVIGWFVRGIDAIPVYRAQDPGSAMAKNRETFDKARALLNEGKAIAIFPEGTSHSDPQLKPLKSGAARIALGAGLERLWIVPAGLYYTSKVTFRSSALLYFGEPIAVHPSPSDADGEPPREATQQLTERIRAALSEVTLQAHTRDALTAVERAERIYSGPARLSERFALRRRFMAKYQELRSSAPNELAALEARLMRFETEVGALGLRPSRLQNPMDKRVGIEIVMMLVGLPIVVAGIVIHYPAYRLVGYLSKRLAKADEDLIATIKVLGAMLFFPLTWLAVAGLLSWRCGWIAGVIGFGLAPLAGFSALLFGESFIRTLATFRVLRCARLEPETYARLRTEQDAIRDQILALRDRGP